MLSDHDLVSALRAGDDRAFECLYERYHLRIAAYVKGMVNDHGRAEDLTQDIFISALRRMRATERPIAFKPWVYEIARNACIDQFRRTRRAEEVSFDGDERIAALDGVRFRAPDACPQAAVDAKQQLDDLCGAFGGLSEAHHQILVLRELEGLSYREIGDRLGLSRASVESTLFRARRRLSEEYDDLASGERCASVQALILTAPGDALGMREQRRLLRHLAHCRRCRRDARLRGLEIEAVSGRGHRRVAAKVAAFMPVPLLLRVRQSDAVDTATSHLGSHAAGPIAALAEPVAGWSKALAAVVTIVVAGGGAGAVSQVGADRPGAGATRAVPAAVEAHARARTGAGRRVAARPLARAEGAGRSGPAAAVTPRERDARGGRPAATDLVVPAVDPGKLLPTAGPEAALPVAPAEIVAPGAESDERDGAPTGELPVPSGAPQVSHPESQAPPQVAAETVISLAQAVADASG